MSRFRLFLAWLIVAAIPLQGLAAASMLFCGPGPHHAPVQAAASQQDQLSHASNGDAAHDHSKHADEAKNEAKDEAKKVGDNTSKKLPGASHKCAVCASCCNLVAVAEFPEFLEFTALPQAALAEPFVLIHPRPSQVPDKPPRA